MGELASGPSDNMTLDVGFGLDLCGERGRERELQPRKDTQTELDSGKDAKEALDDERCTAEVLHGIPLELVHQVAQYLDGRDFVRLAMCSKSTSVMVRGWTRLWREQIMKFALGHEAELILRKEQAMAWPAIYARLWCHENKRCVHCAQPCERPELPTKVPKSARPLCLWAKRFV